MVAIGEKGQLGHGQLFGSARAKVITRSVRR
jgi:hypothetical protein